MQPEPEVEEEESDPAPATQNSEDKVLNIGLECRVYSVRKFNDIVVNEE